MDMFALPDRMALAHKLTAQKMQLARRMTNAVFDRHPELEQKYGAMGRVQSDNDGCFHVDFLAGALVAGSVQSFESYVRWTVAVLGARGVGAETVQASMQCLEEGAGELLAPGEFAIVQSYLAVGRQACLTPATGGTYEVLPEDRWSQQMRAFRTAVLSGERQTALQVIDEAQQQGATLMDVYIGIIAASLQSVGDLWASNQASVAQEHMACSVVQYVIAMLYARTQRPLQTKGNMVVTGVRGEQHQIGLNLVADAMEARGWKVRFLGSNLPHATILEQVQGFAEVVCVSTTMIANLPATAELVDLLSQNPGHKAPMILLGGAAIRLAPEFCKDYKSVRAVHSLREALTILDSAFPESENQPVWKKYLAKWFPLKAPVQRNELDLMQTRLLPAAGRHSQRLPGTDSRESGVK